VSHARRQQEKQAPEHRIVHAGGSLPRRLLSL
jgi:hypothetical protein